MTNEINQVQQALKTNFGDDYKFNVSRYNDVLSVNMIQSNSVSFSNHIDTSVNLLKINETYNEKQAEVLNKIKRIIRTSKNHDISIGKYKL